MLIILDVEDLSGVYQPQPNTILQVLVTVSKKFT